MPKVLDIQHLRKGLTNSAGGLGRWKKVPQLLPYTTISVRNHNNREVTRPKTVTSEMNRDILGCS